MINFIVKVTPDNQFSIYVDSSEKIEDSQVVSNIKI